MGFRDNIKGKATALATGDEFLVFDTSAAQLKTAPGSVLVTALESGGGLALDSLGASTVAALTVTNLLTANTTAITSGTYSGALVANSIAVTGTQTQTGVATFVAKIEAELGISDADLILESLNPMTIKLNDVNALSLDNAAISGFAAAADTAGQDVFIESQDGGVDTAVDGGDVGGAISIKAGDASVGGADQAGAAGGSFVISAGSGSNAGADSGSNPVGGDAGTISLAVGAAGTGTGTGVDGDPGKVKVSGGPLDFANGQVIDMADATVVLTRNPGTPVGTSLVSNVLFVDPNQGTPGTEVLELPPEADCNGLVLYIINTADAADAINIKNDAGTDPANGAVTIGQNEIGMVACNGTAWYAVSGVV
jgi:hypothetical protein